MRTAKWIVVGAGPGGVAVVGNLLSNNNYNFQEIIWIDPSFTSGKLIDVQEIPSNTKVPLFLKFFNVCPYLHKLTEEILAADSNPQHPLRVMQTFDNNGGCALGEVVKVVSSVTTRMLEDVPHIRGHVTKITQLSNSDSSNRWNIVVQHSNNDVPQTIECSNLILCTGAEPLYLDLHKQYVDPNHKIEMIPLELSFSASKLARKVNEDDIIAVMGTSHSGILVLRNLCTIIPQQYAQKVKEVKIFSRKPLLYAEYMDEGWIKYDNTGLKLVAAQWAKENYDKPNPSVTNLTQIHLWEHPNEEEVYRKEFANCTKIVYAVGYSRIPLPPLFINNDDIHTNEKDISQSLIHDPKTGQLMHNQSVVPGLYGLGIAFPEKGTYPDGNTEHLVGMWKFMDYSRRIVPSWMKEQE